MSSLSVSLTPPSLQSTGLSQSRGNSPIWLGFCLSHSKQLVHRSTHRESLVNFVQFFISSFGTPRCTPSMNQSAIFCTLVTSKRTFREFVMLDPSYVVALPDVRCKEKPRNTTILSEHAFRLTAACMCTRILVKLKLVAASSWTETLVQCLLTTFAFIPALWCTQSTPFF